MGKWTNNLFKLIMTYAIEILEKEIYLLQKCISDWEMYKFMDARTQRENKLKDLKTALEKLKL
jgi:hypothetical protein